MLQPSRQLFPRYQNFLPFPNESNPVSCHPYLVRHRQDLHPKSDWSADLLALTVQTAQMVGDYSATTTAQRPARIDELQL